MMKYPTISRLSIEDRKQYKDSQKKQSLSSFDDVMQYVLQEYYLKDRCYRNKSSLQSMAYNLAPQFVNEISVFGVMYDAGLGKLLESERKPEYEDIENCKKQLKQVFAEPQVDNVLNIVLKALGEEKLLAENRENNNNKTNVKTGQPRPIATEQKSREVQPERDSLNNNGIHSIKAEQDDADKKADTQGISKEKNRKKSRNRGLLAVSAVALVICILLGIVVSNSTKQKNNVADDKKTASTQQASSTEKKSTTENSKTSEKTERTTAKESDLKQNTDIESEYDDNQIVGCIVHAGEYTYINKNGVVIETSTLELYDDVLCIYGVHVENVQTGYKLNTEDATVLNDILTVLQLINKYDMQFDRVRYEFGFVLYRNGIRIIMGNIDGFEFKLRNLGAILSELEGKKGNLDMSKYNESNGNFIFKENKEE